MENSSKRGYPAPDRTRMCCLGHRILEQMVMFLLVTLKRKEDNYGSGMEGNWNGNDNLNLTPNDNPILTPLNLS